jgi:hypothetical protein
MPSGSSRFHCLENLKPKKNCLEQTKESAAPLPGCFPARSCQRCPALERDVARQTGGRPWTALDSLEATPRKGSAGSLTAVSHESEHIHSIRAKGATRVMSKQGRNKPMKNVEIVVNQQIRGIATMFLKNR